MRVIYVGWLSTMEVSMYGRDVVSMPVWERTKVRGKALEESGSGTVPRCAGRHSRGFDGNSFSLFIFVFFWVDRSLWRAGRRSG